MTARYFPVTILFTLFFLQKQPRYPVLMAEVDVGCIKIPQIMDIPNGRLHDVFPPTMQTSKIVDVLCSNVIAITVVVDNKVQVLVAASRTVD